ncbi:ComF family protein [Candidatus Falkowbacteria bacterium]|nr:ComF family protein [Candidatus Falkowbacteria bacterium]
MCRLEILKNKISILGSCFFDAIFPKRCAGCGKQGEWLCKACSGILFFRPQQDCLVCGQPNQDGGKCTHCAPLAHSRRVLCAFSYHQDIPVRLVKIFKYDFVRSADQVLGTLMADFLARQDNIPKELLVLPVPLHGKRHRWRGYNQSALLAEAIASYFGWSYDSGILFRHKATKPQAKMESSARCLNVDGCFSVRSGLNLKGLRVMLVDDVVTTGATVESCALVLKRAGAKSVDVLALIRG